MKTQHDDHPTRSGLLARLFGWLPTLQELLLWEQTKRHRFLDRYDAWWFSGGRGVAIVVLLVVLCVVGGVIGALVPVD